MDVDTPTSNLIKHAKKCFGEDTVKTAMMVKNSGEVREKIVANILRNGTLTTMFEKKDQQHVSYSHRQHSKIETQLVATHLCRH
jgi:hypothetical protein